MKFYLYLFLISCTLALPAAHATDDCQPVGTYKYDNVARIFMNQSNLFTLLKQDSNDHYSLHEVYAYGSQYVHLITDVPDEAMMYAIVTTCEKTSWMGDRWYKLDLHLHATASIEGGGWQRRSGKTTLRGSTQPLN